ncbi:MAG: 50S ribosomal protein L18a [Euryarchaeota archaeon]|nr:50S ribosomal protein L18a [Euryarchaeota archaeon]
MRVKNFRVEGRFLCGDRMQRFSVVLRGVREEDVIEKVLSEFGSRNRVKRRNIEIERVTETEEVEE